jgi:hypothetical protein
MKLIYTTLLALSLCAPAVAQVVEPEYTTTTIPLGPCQSQAQMSNDALNFGFDNVVHIGDGDTAAILPTIKIFTRPDGSFMIHFLMADGTECHGVEGESLVIIPFEVVATEPA